MRDGAASRRRTAAGSATCACRSPTAATSAASTACPPRGCRGSSATRSCTSRRSSGSWRCWPSMGVSDVRLTGGEPLVRRDFPTLVGDARRRSSRTSRHHQRLPARARRRGARRAPAPTRFNVSIDSLQRDRFFEMTRRDALPQRAARPRGARRASPRRTRSRSTRSPCAASPRTRCCPFAQLRPRAPLRGALHRVHAARRRPRLDARQRPDRRGDPRDRSSAVCPLEPVPREPHATARVYRFADGRGRDRLHQPGLRAVLRRLQPHPPDRRRPAAHVPVLAQRDRPARRRCATGADDGELEQIVRDAVWRKELKHHVNEPGFVQPARTMSAIGG